MSSLCIDRIEIRQDEAGRYYLSDLHRAAGAELRHRPSTWLQNAQTRALIAEMEAEGASRDSVRPVATVNDGTANGTYVAKELVYAYAMWISPAFHLRVIRAYDAMAARGASARAPALPDFTDPAAAAEAWAAQYRAAEAAKLEAVTARERVQALEPRAAALQRIAEADGCMCLTDAAKALQIAPRTFIRRLSETGWIYRRGATWVPYQARIESGHLRAKVTVIGYDADDRERVTHQALVTPKGLALLAQRMEQRASRSLAIRDEQEQHHGAH